MMEILVGIGCVLLMVLPVVVLWIVGIDHMKNKYPDYKGEDFLNWESSETIVEFPKKEIKNVKVKVKSVEKYKPKKLVG